MAFATDCCDAVPIGEKFVTLIAYAPAFSLGDAGMLQIAICVSLEKLWKTPKVPPPFTSNEITGLIFVLKFVPCK